MKKVLLPLCAVSALALTGCLAPIGPIPTLVTMNTGDAGQIVDNSVKPIKSGKAVATGLILLTQGDASIDAAMKDGGITKVHHVDYEYNYILGIIGSKTTIVWGE